MKTVRIATAEGASPAVGIGTRITDADTGEMVHGVARCDISIAPDEIVTARIRLLLVEIDVTARPAFYVIDPRDGVERAVKKIEFVDGSVFEPSA